MRLSVNRLNAASALVLMVQLLVQPVYADDQYVTSNNQQITQGREICSLVGKVEL